MLVLAREMSVNGLRAIASSEGLTVPSDSLGKAKTALQMIGIMCLVVHYPYKVYFIGLHEALVDFNNVGVWTLIIATVFGFISGGKYTMGFLKALDAKQSSQT